MSTIPEPTPAESQPQDMPVVTDEPVARGPGMVDCQSCGQTFFGSLKPDGRCPMCNGFPRPVVVTPQPQDTTPAEPAQATRYAVRVDRLPDQQKLPRRFAADLTVEGENLVLRGPVKRGIFRRRTEDVQVSIPLVEVMNVASARRLLSFERIRGSEQLGQAAIVAKNAQDAAAIASVLPQAATPRFAERVRAVQELVAAAKQTTPHIFVTHGLVIVNVLVFVIMVFAGVGWSGRQAETMLAWGGNFGPVTTGGQWWRLLTSAFLHFDPAHLIFNMWALYAAGVVAERLFGNGFFALLYLFGALTGSAASIWWNEATVSAGASGAVFAVYGSLLAYVAMQPKSMPGLAVKSMAKSTGGFVLYNVGAGLMVPFIDNACHIGGLAGGIVLGMILARPLAQRPRQVQMMPRLFAAVVFGAAVLGATVWNGAGRSALWTGDEAFRKAIEADAGPEDELLKKVNDVWTRNQAGTAQPAEVIAQLERAAAVYDRFAHEVSAIELHPRSNFRRLREMYVEYWRMRRDSMQAFRDGAAGDAQRMKEGEALRDKADKMVQRIQLHNGASR